MFLKNYITRDAKMMKKFFITFVHPILETNSFMRSPLSVEGFDKIEWVQRWFLSKIQGFKTVDYPQRLSNLELYSLYFRRIISDLIFVDKIFTGLTLCNIDKHINFF